MTTVTLKETSKAAEVKNVLTPFVLSVLETLFQGNEKLKEREITIHEFKEHVDQIMQDEDVKPRIKAIEKSFTEEPRLITGFRNVVRPVITIILTLGFVGLIGWGVVGANDLNQWSTVLAVFLAIYGPIIGFWFGEHTALKGRVPRRR